MSRIVGKNYHSMLRKTERANILTGILVSKASHLIYTILIEFHNSRPQSNYSRTPDTSTFIHICQDSKRWNALESFGTFSVDPTQLFLRFKFVVVSAGDSSTVCRENLTVLTGRRVSGGGGGTESFSGHPPPRASRAGGRAVSRRVTDV